MKKGIKIRKKNKQFKKLKIADFQTGKLPAVAVSIIESDFQKIVKQIAIANNASCDLIEWRVDFFISKFKTIPSLNELKVIAKSTNKPMIFTWRTFEEGGQAPFKLEMYLELYRRAVASNFQVLDIEYRHFNLLRTFISEVEGEIPIICSWHDFNHVSKSLLSQGIKMSQTGAEIIKVAVMPQTSSEVDLFLKETKKLNNRISQPLISVAMGSKAQNTRLIGYKFGSSLTFGSLKDPSAPGQYNVEILRRQLNELNRL